MPVGEVTENQRDNGVDRPSIKAPVKIADLDGLGRCGGGATWPSGWRQKMHNRLGDAVKHHANADPRRKQHRKPRNVAIRGLGMVWPQLDISVPR